MDRVLMIREEDLATNQAVVRATVFARLEQIWQACEPYITGDLGKPDPRYLEAGIRTCDRLSKLYRLDSPMPTGGEDEGEVRQDAREVAIKAVAALEERIRGSAGA